MAFATMTRLLFRECLRSSALMATYNPVVNVTLEGKPSILDRNICVHTKPEASHHTTNGRHAVERAKYTAQAIVATAGLRAAAISALLQQDAQARQRADITVNGSARQELRALKVLHAQLVAAQACAGGAAKRNYLTSGTLSLT
jgi:hypothetical protein